MSTVVWQTSFATPPKSAQVTCGKSGAISWAKHVITPTPGHGCSRTTAIMRPKRDNKSRIGDFVSTQVVGNAGALEQFGFPMHDRVGMHIEAFSARADGQMGSALNREPRIPVDFDFAGSSSLHRLLHRIGQERHMMLLAFVALCAKLPLPARVFGAQRVVAGPLGEPPTRSRHQSCLRFACETCMYVSAVAPMLEFPPSPERKLPRGKGRWF